MGGAGVCAGVCVHSCHGIRLLESEELFPDHVD